MVSDAILNQNNKENSEVTELLNLHVLLPLSLPVTEAVL